MALTKVTSGVISSDASSIDLNIDAGTLYIDASENKVGIQTTSPDTPLDVEGSGGIRVNEDGSGTKVIGLRSDFAGVGPAVNVSSNHPLLLMTNNTERARITEAGTLAVGASANAQGSLTLSNAGAEQMEFFIGNSSNLNTTQHYNRSGASYVDNRVIANTHQFYSGAVQAVRINGSYNMGIGSDGDSTHRLRLTAGTGAARCLNLSVGNSGLCVSTNNASGTASYDAFAFTTGGGSTQVGGIVVGGSSTAYNTTSDYRLKENVDYTWDATTRLNQLRPARFNWIIDDTNTLVDGFLAHEVEDIVPEAITGTKDATETLTNVVRSAQGLVLAEGITEANWTAGKADAILWTEDDILPEGISVGDVKTESTYPSDSTWTASLEKDVYQQIDQAKLVPLLVKTIQELEARITTLENA